MNTAEQIKQSADMLDAVNHYGFGLNSRGFMVCPFHQEDTPSFKVYSDNQKWKCFGCGKGGSVIDFVMALFNINFRQAVIRIDNDFGLHLQNEKLSRQKHSEIMEKKRREQNELKAYRNKYDKNVDRFRRCRFALRDCKPASPDEALSDEFVEALHNYEYLKYWFEQNTYR